MYPRAKKVMELNNPTLPNNKIHVSEE